MKKRRLPQRKHHEVPTLPPLQSGQELAARVFRIAGQDLLCEPTDVRYQQIVKVHMPDRKAAQQCPRGALVLLRLRDMQTAGRFAPPLWQGELVHCYGREDDARVQEAFVRLNHQVPDAFPDQVLAQAANLPQCPGEADMAGREDLRHFPLVTIDGEDARDFDDAIQVERQGEGWLLRVAIADVSHYIPLETRSRKICLDTEAQERGNSWYFPLSVSPMLPEALSNGLCSLNPGVDRLVMLCEIPFSADGEPGKAHFAQAVMRSAARLTYTQVKRLLLDKDNDIQASLQAQPQGAKICDMLADALALSRILRARRMERGSLDFHQPEPAYSVTGDGRVEAIYLAEHNAAHELIEEFMLAANEAVAAFLRDSALPFLYRVHPEPGEENLERLKEALLLAAPDCLPSGVKAPGKSLQASHIREILRLARGTEREHVVDSLCLRSLAQARYQSIPLEHFGLSSNCYCHFTSPIRRYADLTVHRALKVALGLSQGPLLSGAKLERLAAHCNHQERAAQESEREMARRMACLAMIERVGEVFDGIVSSVLSFGSFVALDGLPVEAFVRRHRLPHKRRAAHSAKGQWLPGQKVRVRLTSVSLGRLTIDCEPVGSDSPRKKGGQAKYRRRMR